MLSAATYEFLRRLFRLQTRKMSQIQEIAVKRLALWILPLFLVFANVTGLAQSTNAGDIRGTVTDASGALIPGVTVTVTNVDTGVMRTLVTNDAGIYDTGSIVTGSYTLTFSKEGFQKAVRGPVTLQVGFTTVNADLRVGSIADLALPIFREAV